MQHRVTPSISYFIASFVQSLHWQLHEQMQLKCDLKCTFSATSSAPFSASLYSFRSEPLGTIPGVLLGAPYFASSSLPQTHRCYVLTLLCINRCTKSSFLFSFSNWLDFVSICTLKSISKSIVKSVPYALSFKIKI